MIVIVNPCFSRRNSRELRCTVHLNENGRILSRTFKHFHVINMIFVMCIIGNIFPTFSLCFFLSHMKTHGGGGRVEGRGSTRAQSQDVCRSGQCSCFSLLLFLSSLSYDFFSLLCPVLVYRLLCVSTSVLPCRFLRYLSVHLPDNYNYLHP